MANEYSKDRFVAITYRCNRSCEYCYAKELISSFLPQEISIDDFSKVLDWFEKQEIRYFNLIGGEPMIHSKIINLLNMVKEKGMQVDVFTNGLFNENAICSHPAVNDFVINYSQPRMYNSKEFELVHKKMNLICKAGKRIIFFYNMYRKGLPFNHVLDACKKYNINSINFSISFPNFKRSNRYVSASKLKELTKDIIKFIKVCKENGVRARLARAMPYCIFTLEERIFIREKSNLSGKCNSAQRHYIINPDLTIFPCTLLTPKSSKKLNLVNIENENEIEEYYKKEIYDLRWRRKTFDECDSCKFFIRRQCQGSCLAYKI